MVRLTPAFENPSPRTDLPPRTSYPPTVQLGGSIASEGKGEYMYVEGHVRDTSGTPISGAVIDTWETDSKGERGASSVPLFPKLTLSTRSALLPLCFQKASMIRSTRIALSRTAVVGS